MKTALCPRSVSRAILSALLLGAPHVLAAPAFVSAPTAEVRSAPFVVAPVIETLWQAGVLDVSLKAENGWRYVRLADGRSGYVEDAKVSLVEGGVPRDHGTALLATPSGGPPHQRWYGWQLVLSDVTFLVAGSQSKGGPVGVAATLGLALGAPALHFANGDATTGLVSLAVRGLVFGGLAAAGASWKPSPACNDDTCKKQIGDVVPSLLAALAVVSFIVLDDTLLSRRNESADAPATAPPIARRMLAPALAPTSGGATLAMLGTF